jgi:nucleoside-diphosphate-sugar epimerase
MAGNLLITGSAKGLGKYLLSQLGGLGLTRENSSEILETYSAFSTIIHCAFSNPLEGAKTDNISLTESLLNLKFDKFIFISSTDVYPDDDKLHTEIDTLYELGFRSEYAEQKVQCERLVLKARPSALIIRPVTILSQDPKSRNLQRLLNDLQPSLSLTETSTLNFITANEILAFIELALKNNLTGTYNLARNDAASLNELANAVGKKVNFGSFRYNVGHICNKKALNYIPSLNESSLVFFKRWLAEK